MYHCINFICLRSLAKFSIRQLLNPCLTVAYDDSNVNTNCFRYLSHPINRVVIVGTIINVQHSSKRIQLLIDDSTGTMNCLIFPCSSNLPSQLFSVIKLGDIINVQGKLSCYAGKREILVDYMNVLDDCENNAFIELFHLLQAEELADKFYSKPSKIMHKSMQSQAKLANSDEANENDNNNGVEYNADGELLLQLLTKNRLQSFSLDSIKADLAAKQSMNMTRISKSIEYLVQRGFIIARGQAQYELINLYKHLLPIVIQTYQQNNCITLSLAQLHSSLSSHYGTPIALDLIRSACSLLVDHNILYNSAQNSYDWNNDFAAEHILIQSEHIIIKHPNS
jgi:DNA/RNA endonuclease YhcR with UshA esterase domain